MVAQGPAEGRTLVARRLRTSIAMVSGWLPAHLEHADPFAQRRRALLHTTVPCKRALPYSLAPDATRTRSRDGADLERVGTVGRPRQAACARPSSRLAQSPARGHPHCSGFCRGPAGRRAPPAAKPPARTGRRQPATTSGMQARRGEYTWAGAQGLQGRTGIAWLSGTSLSSRAAASSPVSRKMLSMTVLHRR